MLLLNKKNIFTFYLLYNWSLDVPLKFFWTKSRVLQRRGAPRLYIRGGGGRQSL